MALRAKKFHQKTKPIPGGRVGGRFLAEKKKRCLAKGGERTFAARPLRVSVDPEKTATAIRHDARTRGANKRRELKRE